MNQSMLLVGLLVSCGIATANPTTSDFTRPLDAHGTIDGAAARVQSMYAKLAEWEQLTIDELQSMTENRRIGHKQLSRAFAESFRGVWYAKVLQTMGEPAGYDLENRFVLLRKQFRRFLPQLSSFQRKEIAKLAKQNPKRLKILEQASKSISDGKYEQAERAIQAFHLAQLQSVFYLSNSQAKPFEENLSALHRQVLDGYLQQQRLVYREQAMVKIASHTAAIERLESEAKRVVAELAQNPVVQLGDDNRGDAAAAVQYIGQLWGNASASISRAVGIAWVFQAGGPGDVADRFLPSNQRAENAAREGLAGILKSAAASTPADAIAEVYPKVLLQLSILDRQVVGRFNETLTSELQSLANKNPAFATQTLRYKTATGEPLRWRKRFAAQQARSITVGYPPSLSLLSSKRQPSTESARPLIYGNSGSRERVLTPSSFGQSANWTVADARSLLGTKVSADSIVRVSPTANVALSPADGQHYTKVTVGLEIQPQLQDLAEAMLIAKGHAALSIEAAAAQSSAVRQEFDAVGGELQQLSMESMATRLITLSDVIHCLTPLNRLPRVATESNAARQTLWRLEITPQWVKHPFFVAKIIVAQ